MLDVYFLWTANLGTHTFFMIFLPLLFWFGYPQLGRRYMTVYNSPEITLQLLISPITVPAWYQSWHLEFSGPDSSRFVCRWLLNAIEIHTWNFHDWQCLRYKRISCVYRDLYHRLFTVSQCHLQLHLNTDFLQLTPLILYQSHYS